MKPKQAPTEQSQLLRWLNSLDVDSCILATGLEDLQKGEVLLDLAAHITGKGVTSGVRRKSLGAPALKADCVHNLGLLMKDFAALLPPHLRIKPAELVDDHQALFNLVKFFKSMKEGGSGSPVKERKWQDAALLSPSTPQKPVPALNLKALHFDQQQSKFPLTPQKSAIDSYRKSALLHTPSRQSIKEKTTAIRQVQDEVESLKVPTREKNRLFAWLQSLDLFPKAYILADVEALTRSGVLLCDLVNRLEGKNAVIRGIERYPKNSTATLANLTKALTVLRAFDKLGSRYLWSAAELMKGEEGAIWGLLGDIWSYYKGKSAALQDSLSARHRLSSQTRAPSTVPVLSRLATAPSSPKSLRSLSRLAKSKGDTSMTQSLSRESLSALPQPSPREMEGEVRAWLTELRFGHFLGHGSRHFLEDPFKNGVLLCELVSLLEGIDTLQANKRPSTVAAARENVESALAVLRAQRPELPGALLRLGEKIVQGNSKAIWSLLWTLHRLHAKDASPVLPALLDLPYSDAALKRLDQSLAGWIHSLGVSHLAVSPQGVMELLPAFRSGVLLGELVQKVLKMPIHGLVSAPKSDSTSLSNLRKALEPLRVTPQMCQEYVWRDKELQYGDLASLYGLLEDLHRLYDSQPPRRPGIHSEMPYLGPVLPVPHFPEAGRSRHKVSLSAVSASDLDSQKRTPYAAHFRGSRMESRDSETDQDLGKTLPRDGLFLDNPRIFLTFDSTLSRAQETGDWLEGWLDRVGVQYPVPFSLRELRNGVVLCRTLEKLTGGKVPGCTDYPKTTAAALNNVRKALEVLRKRPGFPKELMFVEEEVVRGTESTLIALFAAIRGSYKSKERLSLLTSRRSSEKYRSSRT